MEDQRAAEDAPAEPAPALVPQPAEPYVSRLVLLPSGEALVGFCDRSLVALNAPGAAFTAHAADGSRVRGLTSCVVRAPMARQSNG